MDNKTGSRIRDKMRTAGKDKGYENGWGIMSADERAKYIGIPRSTLYALFGASGAVAGRRPKHLIET